MCFGAKTCLCLRVHTRVVKKAMNTIEQCMNSTIVGATDWLAGHIGLSLAKLGIILVIFL